RSHIIHSAEYIGGRPAVCSGHGGPVVRGGAPGLAAAAGAAPGDGEATPVLGPATAGDLDGAEVGDTGGDVAAEGAALDAGGAPDDSAPLAFGCLVDGDGL